MQPRDYEDQQYLTNQFFGDWDMHIDMDDRPQPPNRAGATPTASVRTAKSAPANGWLANCWSDSSARALVMKRVRRSGPPNATLVTLEVGSSMRASTRASSGAWQVTQLPAQCAIHRRPALSVVMPSG